MYYSDIDMTLQQNVAAAAEVEVCSQCYLYINPCGIILTAVWLACHVEEELWQNDDTRLPKTTSTSKLADRVSYF